MSQNRTKPMRAVLAGFGLTTMLVLGAGGTVAFAAEEPTVTTPEPDVVVVVEDQEATSDPDAATTDEPAAEEPAPAPQESTEPADPSASEEYTDTAPSEEPVVEDANEAGSEETEEAEQPTTETETPSYPTCVQNPVFAYTFDPVTVSGIIIVSGGELGQKLCDTLAVRTVIRSYVLPAVGNPSWPQDLNGVPIDTMVNAIGTFTYGDPSKKLVCGQGEPYAAFASQGGFDALAVPERLLEPQKPDEPPFLHEALPGKGPNPTWSTTPSEGCNPPAQEPVEVTASGSATTVTCESDSRNHALLEAAQNGQWGFYSASGSVKELVPVGEGYDGGIPRNFGYEEITVVLNDADPNDLFDVKSFQFVWAPKDANELVCGESSVTGEVTEDCLTAGVVTFHVENATQVGKTATEVGSHTAVFEADYQHRFISEEHPEGLTTLEVNYEVPGPLGYQSENPNLLCYKAPTVTPVVHTPDEPDEDLAVTGPSTLAIAWVAGGAIVLGAAGMIIARRRQPVVATE